MPAVSVHENSESGLLLLVLAAAQEVPGHHELLDLLGALVEVR